MTEDDPFVAHRGLLFTVAYEMLGSAADAEDVLQESWLRWTARSQDGEQEEVRDPRAYLVRVVTRQSLNRLRTLQRQRETYVGPWLPEPLVTAPDVLERRRLPARTADAARSRHLTAAVAQGSVDVELDPHGAELDADPAAAVRLPRESEQVG